MQLRGVDDEDSGAQRDVTPQGGLFRWLLILVMALAAGETWLAGLFRRRSG